jgi:lysophospholipase L1-like esterase
MIRWITPAALVVASAAPFGCGGAATDPGDPSSSSTPVSSSSTSSVEATGSTSTTRTSSSVVTDRGDGSVDSGVAPSADAASQGDGALADAEATRPDAADAELPSTTLWVAGDSTASAYGPASAQQGWGEHLSDFLNPRVTVNDQGFAGRTVVTFLASSHWTTITGGLRAGDYVMIEFGINDSSTAGGRLVSIPDFTTGLETMVDAILAKRATPIMVTPSALQYWVNGVETDVREAPYCAAMKSVAAEKNIVVDDLNVLSVAYLNKIGQTAAAQIYIGGDKAHFTLAGAVEMAKLVTQDLITIGSPLAGDVE